MKKWIKKMTISSGAIVLAGTGASVLVNTTQNKKIDNLEMTSQNQNDSDHFIFHGFTSGEDRTYELHLSSNSVVALSKVIPQYYSNQAKGNIIFNYLAWKWATVTKISYFRIDLKASNDYESVHSLFEQQNPHTWRGGFPIDSFFMLLNYHLKNSTSMVIFIYVDYVFLGHNLYGTNFT